MRPAAIDMPAAPPKSTGRYFAKGVGRAFQARQADGATVIDLFDEVGDFGVTASDFQAQLRDAGDVTLRVNSPGGDAFAGLAIYNMLVAHKGHVRVEIVGLAASAASVIAMAGNEIAIADNAFIMVHRAWGMTIGHEGAHGEAAGVLRQIDGALARTYAARTGRKQSDIASLMAAETWLNADDAIAGGFATERLAGMHPKARFDLSVFAKAPAALAGDIEHGDHTIRDVEVALRDAGFSRSQAKALAAHGHRGETDKQRDAADLAELAAHIHAAANSISI